MNILITGGDGYIAKHLRSFLSNQYIIYAPGKKELNCFDTDQVSIFFKTHSIDIVIHTALTGRDDLFSLDPLYLSNSLLMWKNLYNNRHRFNKLIQFGSAYEFPQNIHNNRVMIDNLYLDFPKSSYGYAKNLMARSCIDTENFYNLRIFGSFHHTEHDQRFFKKLLKSKNFVIDKDREFDYFNLDDLSKVVDFMIAEDLDWEGYQDINLVYSKKYSLYDQVLMFCDIQKINPDIIVNYKGFNLTGNSSLLDSFEIKFDGLENGFKKYNQR